MTDPSGVNPTAVIPAGANPMQPAPGGGAAQSIIPRPKDISIDFEKVEENIRGLSGMVQRLADYSLSLTDNRHWVSFTEAGSDAGAPWLTGPGAEMLITRVGLKVEPIDTKMEYFEFEKKSVMLMTVVVRVSFENWMEKFTGVTFASLVAEGHCMSTDAFLGKGKLLANVDLGNIRQAAYTNALVNGVCRFLGIRKLGWDDVKRLTNCRVDKGKVARTDHKKGGQGGGLSDKEAPKDNDLATPAQVAAVWSTWAANMGVDPVVLATKAADQTEEQKLYIASAGKSFYAWACRYIGDERGNDRRKWTVADCAALKAEAQALADQAPEPGTPTETQPAETTANPTPTPTAEPGQPAPQ